MPHNSQIKIAFIGRKQNTYSKYDTQFETEHSMEKPRLNEEKGFALSQLIKTNNPSNSDLVLIRINPEQTNKKVLKKINSLEKALPSNVTTLNSSENFQLYADKSNSFNAWKEQNINCPEFILFSPWTPLNKGVQTIKTRIKKYGAQYVRTNNEDSGKGIFFITEQHTTKEIKKVLMHLRLRCLFNRTSHSKILSVAQLNNINNKGIGHVFRAHVCCGKILGGYALVSDKKVFHSRDLGISHWDSFIEANNTLITLLKKEVNRIKILDAASALGVDIGAVEFFLIDNDLHFLEINPMWGGQHKFGNNMFMEHLEKHIDAPELFLVKNWLDSTTFYQNMYNQIYKFHMRNINNEN